MISKLPSWVWTGAWLLAFVAGMVNVAGLLGFDRHSITHHTGNTSLLAEALARGNLAEMGQVAAIIAAFVVGCALSGYLVQFRCCNHAATSAWCWRQVPAACRTPWSAPTAVPWCAPRI